MVNRMQFYIDGAWVDPTVTKTTPVVNPATEEAASTVVLGTTGCSMISPQATTIPYSAADGVNVPASGPLKVRNALFVANEDGTTAIC